MLDTCLIVDCFKCGLIVSTSESIMFSSSGFHVFLTFSSQFFFLSLEHLLTINAGFLLFVNFEIPHLCLYNQNI